MKDFLRPLVLPIVILVAAFFLSPLAELIPETFLGLWQTGPYIMFAILAGLGLAYNRGRALLVALLLALTLFCRDQSGYLGFWGQQSFVDMVVMALVPLNLALIGWYRERGVVTDFAVMRLCIIVGQVIVLGAYYWFAPESFDSAISRIHLEFLPVDYPHIGYIVLVICGLSLLASAVVQGSGFTVALFAGYAGIVFGLVYKGQANLLHANGIAVGLILSIAILRDSYDMAYRDELTGLPQRRALNELFMSLGGDYAVAMIDVDHFKKFNDKHGHDIGDDVLKMVASQISQVSDGGKAFRYGGEEFTVVYPGRVKEQALQSLEQLRCAIQDYAMVVRTPRARNDSNDVASAKRGKGASTSAKTVAVTISIGVADRSDRNDSSDQVLKKADKALYRAKKAGRNRITV